MFLGLDFFGYKNGAVYKTEVYHSSYNGLELQNLTIDELFINKDITLPCTIDKPDGWSYTTILDAKFQNNIEGGSVNANNFQIESIRFQRREVDEVEWQDVGEIPYEPSKTLLYEAMDKYIQNGFEYQYSIIPITATILGNRVMSDEIMADFEGVFISDKDNNYRLLYNIETEAIQHNTSSATLEPLNSKYPIIIDGNLDYKSGGIKALFVSTETTNRMDGKVSIKAEKLSRNKLMKFLKNKKPKVLRQDNGETILIRVIDNPQEDYHDGISGLASVSFKFVEVGSMDSNTLRENNMIMGLKEEF